MLDQQTLFIKSITIDNLNTTYAIYADSLSNFNLCGFDSQFTNTGTYFASGLNLMPITIGSCIDANGYFSNCIINEILYYSSSTDTDAIIGSSAAISYAHTRWGTSSSDTDAIIGSSAALEPIMASVSDDEE
jgi:hypothetical protein